MKLDGQLKELFDAFSRINKKAFKDERLLSNHVLSRAPNYGDILRRFLLRTPIIPLSTKDWLTLAFKYLIFNLGHLGFIICARAAIFLSGFKAANIEELAGKNQPLLLVDSFMLLPKVASDGKYREMYLPGLKLDGKIRVNILRLYGSRNPLTVYKAFKALALQKDHEGEPFIALSDLHLLRPGDFGMLLWHILTFPLSLRKLLLDIETPQTNSPEAYIKEALCACAGQCYLIPEARRLSAVNLARMLSIKANPELLRASSLVSWHENQPVNKAFYYGLRQGFGQNPAQTKTSGREVADLPMPVIGAQLFIWPDNLLNCHPDPDEARLGLAPERTLFCGPYFLPEANPAQAETTVPGHGHQQQTSLAAGNNTALNNFRNFQVGPALRYAKLFERVEAAAGQVNQDSGQQNDSPSVSVGANSDSPLPGRSNPAEPHQAGPLLILLSYHPDETMRVLELVKPLADRGLDLRYRFHPASRPADFSALLPDNYKSADGDLYDALNAIKGTSPTPGGTVQPGSPDKTNLTGLVIGSGSGSLAEAVALGVPAINIDDASGIPGLGLNYLPPFGKGQLWENARDLPELEAARIKLRNTTAVLSVKEYAALVTEFREMLFTKPDAANMSKAFN